MKPKMFFKYKEVKTVEQLTRLINSINNNRIFFPEYKKLNDPLESSAYGIKLAGYAGISIMQNADMEDNYLAGIRNTYKILSLSETCFSPSMWAHYTNEHNGVCLGFWNTDSFSSAKRINYICDQINNEKILSDLEELDNAVCQSFFFKHTDWSYEKEWRIVNKQEDEYFCYNPQNLACIIFGDKLDSCIRDIIIRSINLSPAMYYTKIGFRSFGINLLPVEFDIQLNGECPPFIRDVDTLIKDISEKAVIR